MKNTCTHTRTRMHTFRVMWKSREEHLSIIVLKNDVPIRPPKILLILINATKYRHDDQLFLIRHTHVASHSTCSRKSPIHYGAVHVRTHRFIDLSSVETRDSR